MLLIARWVIVAALIWCAYQCGINYERTRLTLLANSPDGKCRLRINEYLLSMDRNFEVVLERTVNGHWQSKTIFRTPDEGRPPGTERAYWSVASDWVLLVGKNFKVENIHTLKSGDQLYFLYHVPSERLWCNAVQKDSERFDIEKVKSIGLAYWLD